MKRAPLSFPERPASIYRRLPSDARVRHGSSPQHRRSKPQTAGANRVTDMDLGLTVWGVDTRGDRFLQEGRAREISLSGALLTCLEAQLRSGDVIGILYASRKAR